MSNLKSWEKNSLVVCGCLVSIIFQWLNFYYTKEERWTKVVSLLVKVIKRKRIQHTSNHGTEIQKKTFRYMKLNRFIELLNHVWNRITFYWVLSAWIRLLKKEEQKECCFFSTHFLNGIREQQMKNNWDRQIWQLASWFKQLLTFCYFSYVH
jgi:hypothetical protein